MGEVGASPVTPSRLIDVRFTTIFGGLQIARLECAKKAGTRPLIFRVSLPTTALQATSTAAPASSSPLAAILENRSRHDGGPATSDRFDPVPRSHEQGRQASLSGSPPPSARHHNHAWRRFVAGELAALSLASGAMSAGPAAAAIPLIDQGATVQNVAQEACALRPASTHPDDLRVWKDTVIDAMIARGNGARSLSPREERSIRAEMSRLPPAVLSVLDSAHIGIAVVDPGQSPIDIGVTTPYDPSSAFADVGALRQQVDAAWQKASQRFDAPISRLDRQIAALRASTSEPDRARRVDLQTQRNSFMHKRSFMFYDEVSRATSGRVEPFTLVDSDREHPTRVRMGDRLATFPTSLEEIATRYGARTPSERTQIKNLVRALNGERLQQALAEAPSHFTPEYARQQQGLPEDQKAFLAREGGIVMPAIHYLRDGANPSAAPRVFTGRDLRSSSEWRHPWAIRGEFVSAPDRATVLVGKDQLGTRPEGISTLMREMGHAYEHAMQKLDPPAFDDFLSRRNESFWRISAGGGRHFVSENAARNPNEMAADTFAYRFSGDVSRLEAADELWRKQFDEWVEKGARIGSECLTSTGPSSEVAPGGSVPAPSMASIPLRAAQLKARVSKGAAPLVACPPTAGS